MTAVTKIQTSVQKYNQTNNKKNGKQQKKTTTNAHTKREIKELFCFRLYVVVVIVVVVAIVRM